MLLYRQGFQALYDAPQYWDESSPDVFRAQALLSGSKLYLVALLLRHEIASRGGFVMHTGTARYSRILLSLQDHVVLDYLRDANVDALEDSLVALEASDALQKPIVPVHYSEGADEANDIDATDKPDASDILDDALPIHLQLYAAETAALRPYQHDTAVRVYFDNCSHSSGKLREYVRCVPT